MSKERPTSRTGESRSLDRLGQGPMWCAYMGKRGYATHKCFLAASPRALANERKLARMRWKMRNEHRDKGVVNSSIRPEGRLHWCPRNSQHVLGEASWPACFRKNLWISNIKKKDSGSPFWAFWEISMYVRPSSTNRQVVNLRSPCWVVWCTVVFPL